MSIEGVVRFEPKGPKSGLAAWPAIDPSGLVSGTPVQKGHTYVEDKALGLECGVWECTPMTAKMGPYSVNEFMVVLDGSVTIDEAGGKSTTIKAGQSFIIPKGLVCAWRQTETIRKFFVIFDDASGAKAKDPGKLSVILPTGAVKLDPSDIPDPTIFVGGVPKQASHTWHTDPTGQWTVGTWDTTPFTRKVAPFNRYELMHILEGSVTISDAAGKGETFKAGDSFMIKKGAPVSWSNKEYVKKIYCIFMPKVAVAQGAAAE